MRSRDVRAGRARRDRDAHVGVRELAGELVAQQLAARGETARGRRQRRLAAAGVSRGGWDDNGPAMVRATFRTHSHPAMRTFDLGVRCARGE